MSCYLIRLRDQIFAKGYGCLSFSEKNNSIGKMIRKNLSSKYKKKVLDHAKQSHRCTQNCFKSNSKNSRSNL